MIPEGSFAQLSPLCDGHCGSSRVACFGVSSEGLISRIGKPYVLGQGSKDSAAQVEPLHRQVRPGAADWMMEGPEYG